MSITTRMLEELQSRIQARYCVLFLTTYEEERWETELANLALDMQLGLVTWSSTEGFIPPLDPDAEILTDPLGVLREVEAYPPDHVILLKDFHHCLASPVVVRKLRDQCGTLRSQKKTLLLMSPEVVVPLDLERDVLQLELPLPDIDDLQDVLTDVLKDLAKSTGKTLRANDEERERLLKAVIGLTAREAGKALMRALAACNQLDDDVFAALVSEKKTLLRGSDLLEFFDLDAAVKDIGGLDGLKDWLSSRASAYSLKARKQGLPLPKGVLLLGVQGCGKSLTARATAKLLSFPLVRLDFAALLSGERGSSEKNLREVLRTIETIAPTVLWLDEVEKAFSGVSTEGGGDGTLTRLFGTFLTWLQDHGKPIFVIATANSVATLPPEMLRRGRFDELFFINLPNFHERKDILDIHLKKRKLDPKKYDVNQLSNKTEGYSGAEIEQLIISATFEAYTAGRAVTQEDLLNSQEQTVPLSVTMEEKIFQLREWARTRCRPATPDSRVMQMLEEESRQ